VSIRRTADTQIHRLFLTHSSDAQHKKQRQHFGTLRSSTIFRTHACASDQYMSIPPGLRNRNFRAVGGLEDTLRTLKATPFFPSKKNIDRRVQVIPWVRRVWSIFWRSQAACSISLYSSELLSHSVGSMSFPCGVPFKLSESRKTKTKHCHVGAREAHD
jgi:hypothetical protein